MMMSSRTIDELRKMKIEKDKIYFEIGQIYRIHSDYKNAILFFKKSLQIKEVRETFLKLAICYNMINDDKTAIEIYKRIISQYKGNTIIYGNLGASYSKIGNKKRAIKYLRKALDENKNDVIAWTNLSAVYAIEKNFKEAKEILIEGEQHNPGNKEIILRLADISSQKLNELEDAIKYYESILNLDEEDVNVLIGLANSYSNLQNAEKAIELYKRVLKIDKKNIVATSMIGIAYLSIFKPKIAKRWVDKAVKIDPDNINTILVKARYLDSIHKSKDAIKIAKIGIQLHPENNNLFFLYIIIGNACNKMNKYEDAKSWFEKAKEHAPSDINVLRLGGLPYAFTGNYSKAIEYWEKYLQINPNDYEFLGHLGSCYLNSNELTKAITCFEQCIKLEPNQATYYVLLAKAYIQSKKFKEALLVYDKQKKVDKTSEPYLLAGDVYFLHIADFQKAVNEYEKAMKINPDNWKAWSNLYISYNVLKKKKSAERCLEIASDQSPEPVVIFSQEIDVLIRIGRIEDAEIAFQSIIDKYPKNDFLWYLNACILSIKKDFDGSIKALDKAIGINNNLFWLMKAHQDPRMEFFRTHI